MNTMVAAVLTGQGGACTAREERAEGLGWGMLVDRPACVPPPTRQSGMHRAAPPCSAWPRKLEREKGMRRGEAGAAAGCGALKALPAGRDLCIRLLAAPAPSPHAAAVR